jgi:TetR/AcrR family transcriptional regulator
MSQVALSSGSDSSRHRIFQAGATEFALHGFAGGSVDRIAKAAGLNKAMIYYHFENKAELYREILREMFTSVEARVRHTAESDATAEDKIRAFVEAIAHEAEARPHFPPIWFREIADGGAHLDHDTVSRIANIVRMLAAVIQEGVAAGTFRPMSPLLVHGGIVGPLLLYFASGGLRLRVDRAGVSGAAGFGRDEVVAHIQRIALGTLQGRI